MYLCYAGYFIFRTSFIVNGERYFVLFDDAAISMTYAKNFAEGHGLVWNAGGERVEGFTNPLWVIYMSFFHLFPIPASKMGLPIQISGAVFLVFNLYFVKKITDELAGENAIVSAMAVILTAFYYPLNNWSLQGLEVGALALISTFAAWQVIVAMKENRPATRIFVLLGVATLIRLDAVVIYIVFLIGVLLYQPVHRKSNLLWGIGLLVAFLGVQTGFRYWYYGELLPNTYYLKMTGVSPRYRIFRGAFILAKFLWELNWVMAALPFVVLLFRRDRNVLLLFALFAGQMAYSVYVGGDAWEHKGGANRYIATTISSFFILSAYAIWLIQDSVRRQVVRESGVRHQWLANGIMLLFVGFSLLSLNQFLGQDFVKKWMLIKKPLFIEGQEENVRIALALNKISTPETTVALVSAGNIPYLTDFIAIDLLGKSDYVIARLDMHIEGGYENFRPGHNKWDYDYSIGKLQPDLVVQLWEGGEDALKYLQRDYVAVLVDGWEFSARRDSPNVIWENVEAISEIE